jgi:hypothetical protein
LEKEREKLKKSSIAMQSMPPVQDFSIISKFTMNAAAAAYLLTVELQVRIFINGILLISILTLLTRQTPIDLIILRSPVVLDLVETGILLFLLLLYIYMCLFFVFMVVFFSISLLLFFCYVRHWYFGTLCDSGSSASSSSDVLS